MSEDLTPQKNAQLLHLLQDNSHNIRHAKRQQWQAGYYTVLGYGGLVAAARWLTYYETAFDSVDSCIFHWVVSALTALSGFFGVSMVWHFQCWMRRLRKKMSLIEGMMPAEYRTLSGRNGDGRSYESVFYESRQAWMISFVIVMGSIIGLFIIWVSFFAQ